MISCLVFVRMANMQHHRSRWFSVSIATDVWAGSVWSLHPERKTHSRPQAMPMELMSVVDTEQKFNLRSSRLTRRQNIMFAHICFLSGVCYYYSFLVMQMKMEAARNDGT